MNEYRIQRLKEDLTFAQQRNKHQKQQLANYKNVHEKDLKEIERLNNIIKNIKNLLEEYDTKMHLDDTIYIDEKFKKKLEEIIND